MIRLLLATGVDFPHSYASSGSLCALERAVYSKLDADIWTSLVQQVVEGDRTCRKNCDEEGHTHDRFHCGAPLMAVYCGRTIGLNALLSHKYFLSTIKSDPGVWSIALGVGATVTAVKRIELLSEYAKGVKPAAGNLPPNHVAVIELLLSKGVDPNVKVNFCPLAACQNHALTRRQLMADYYEETSVRCEPWTTPLEYAEWTKNDQAIALLRQSGAKRLSRHLSDSNSYDLEDTRS
jgi:hypothetical protein